MGKKSECCESYKKKGKFCKDCPLPSQLDADEQRRLLGSSKKGKKGKKGRKGKKGEAGKKGKKG